MSSEDRLGRALLATGFGYDPEVRARQADVLRRVLPQVRDIRRIGSAALDLVRVAEGTVDAYAESGINAWDLAAGWLIVEEAGGVVMGVGSRPGKALTVAAGRGAHRAAAGHLPARRAANALRRRMPLSRSAVIPARHWVAGCTAQAARNCSSSGT